MGTLLFGVITGPDLNTAGSLLEIAKSHIDGVELRLDYFNPFKIEELKSFMQKCRLPIMITLRRNDQGGHFQGTEEERLDLLESLCALQPAYVDLEYDVPSDYRKRLFDSYPNILFLSSYHDFSSTPSDLEEIYKKIKTPHAHIYKMAFTAKSGIDAMKLLLFVQSHSKADKIIGISMGEEGKPTRILAPVVGSYLTYATLSSDASTAPGQLTARELQEVYHFRTLDPHTDIYCLIGDPVDKSLGPIAHNAVFADYSLNAVYVKFQVKKEEVESFLSLAQKFPFNLETAVRDGKVMQGFDSESVPMGDTHSQKVKGSPIGNDSGSKDCVNLPSPTAVSRFRGISVTMPLKEAVIPLLSQASSQVTAMGACNTIKLQDNQLIGYNTDGTGALNAIERKMLVSGQHVVIIGAGGAAKSLAFEAIQRRAFVTIINRTASRATELADALGCRGGGWELFPEIVEMDYDVIINCIPEGDLIEEKWILPKKIAMDIVYIPKNTPFLIKASRNQCRLVFGYEMFISQALEQELIWLSDQINYDKAYAIIEEKVIQALN